MGLFDRFKKNNDKNKPENQAPQHSELYLSLSKYSEYIVSFILMQRQGNYAPISAYEKPGSGVRGFLYMGEPTDLYSLSAQQVVDAIGERFEQQWINKQIESYVILYHSQFAHDNNHKLAGNDAELKAITVAYQFKDGSKGKIGLPYSFDKDDINYQGFTEFTREENDSIFKTELQQGKDYFQDREPIKQPETENGIGLKIRKANTANLTNTWCGIFGFDSYRKPGGAQALREHFALALARGTTSIKDNITVSRLDYGAVVVKAVASNEAPVTVIPVIQTDFVVDVENKEIIEWENVDNLEAIITGTARDTFRIDYFATDYMENRDIYLSKKKQNVRISGIAFVLDTSTIHESSGEVKYSDDFTMYMPNNDLPNYACFDFVGEVEGLKEIEILEGKMLKAYIIKVRLITNPDIADFFTIDMYATAENMRFKELTKGMKITGVFQMQGQIAG